MNAAQQLPTVAAIDIGSNSVKLLVRRGHERIYETHAVRLGEGMGSGAPGSHRVLQAAAMDRTLALLARYAQTARELGAEALAAVATSATRDAANRDDFLDRAGAVLGTRPIILSGEEEGRLAFLGSLQDLPSSVGMPRVVLDIGGGSTEFVLGDTEVLGVQSLNIGCVRLTESHLRADPPRADELSNAIGHVADHFDDVLRDLPGLQDTAALVGIGGTIVTAAAVELGRMDIDELHGFWLSRPAAEDVFRTLATERLEDRVHNPGLPADRAPIIVGGLCILVAVMRRLKADGITVSLRTLADGVCASMRAGSWPLPGGAQ